jgi:hypothetical protein
MRTARPLRSQVSGVIEFWCKCCMVLAWLLPVAAAAADGRHSVAFDLGSAAIHYHKQYRLPVDDQPKHTLRIYDLSREFAPGSFNLGSVAVTTIREWGSSDLVDENGTDSAYVMFVLADGSRVVGRYRGTVGTRRWPDGSRHYDIRGAIDLTGGTGAFEHIRGTINTWQALDPGADSSQGRAEGEYWFER